MPRLSKHERDEAERLLEELQTMQTELWDKAYELEELLGIEIDMTEDLEARTIDSLMEKE